jgi:RNA polymerase sigma-70 factor (ECF subfamily)
MTPSPTVNEVRKAVSIAHDEQWAFVLAATARVSRDLDLAEDCVQDAYAQALTHWPVTGIPERPGGWLTTVATRRALEHARRSATLARKLTLLVPDLEGPALDRERVDERFPDDRLRLIFTCCHPALTAEAQVALTLRLVAGLSSAEVARAFLVREAAMQARITRAKKKIAQAGIPYRLPTTDDLPERVGAVLDVIHLVYTSGYTSASGECLTRDDLSERAVHLARMLDTLLPGRPDVHGLLALLLLTEARRPARTGSRGQLVLLEDQDRNRWDHAMIRDGQRLLRHALTETPVHRYTVMAAIAAIHDEASAWAETDWDQIVGLYDVLAARWPSPVVALNRCVAHSFTEGPERALQRVEMLSADPALAAYPYLAATRADLLRRLQRDDEAADAYDEAAMLTGNSVEAAYLTGRSRRLRGEHTTPTGGA